MEELKYVPGSGPVEWLSILWCLEDAKKYGQEVKAHIMGHTFCSKDFNRKEAIKILDEIEELVAIPGKSWVPLLEELEIAQKEGRKAYLHLYGHDFCSWNLDMDKAYIFLTGKPRPRDAKYVYDHTLEWVKRGIDIIYPERASEWVAFVDKNGYQSWDYGELIDYALKLMEMIERGCSKEEVNSELDNMVFSRRYVDGELRNNKEELRNIVLRFSKKGPEFFEINPESEDYDNYLKIIIENQQFAEAERLRKENVPTGGVPGKK